MKNRVIRMAFCLVLGGALLWLLPSTGFSQIVNVNCNGGETIQAAINAATSPVTISVTGTCEENLLINEFHDYLRLVVPTGQTATIGGQNPGLPTIAILGKGVTIGHPVSGDPDNLLKGSLTIKGNFDGIQVIRGGTAFIEFITIKETGRHGIIVAMNSFAHIVNSTIQGNQEDGVVVDTNSLVRIGIRSSADSAAIANTIEGNANGVTVARSSTAQIVGNTIRNNSNDGIRVAKVSQADISNNVIEGNGRNGILVTQNSGVNLGRDTGDTIFDLPNSSTVPNGAYGLQCEIGGYADGRLGTLNGGAQKGAKGATSFTKDCIDSLLP